MAVEVAQIADGTLMTLTTTSDVFVRWIDWRTWILLLSGTGPNEELGQVGVELSVELSYGGKHLPFHL
ncbi:hypothetical protein K435DRAFT_965926 [Dendrothele bispora CBS 962.96]|uniref:Uncharacterized protein n=1 Tax=Dendrothele bispora (strain CBS 962.96) TaxID=1314807 RepID=A0A4S8M2X4_DENBC|nr:hypothetical protein K435DRAFT_965926 [Dendrothele bispora CBS 962.96]